MSLINDMLTDLDKRRASSPGNGACQIPESLAAVPGREMAATHVRVPLLAATVVVIAISCYSGTRWLRSAMATMVGMDAKPTVIVQSAPPALEIGNIESQAHTRPSSEPTANSVPAKSGGAEAPPTADLPPPEQGPATTADAGIRTAVRLRFSSKVESNSVVTDSDASTTAELVKFESLLAAAPPAAAPRTPSILQPGEAIPTTTAGEGWAEPAQQAKLSYPPSTGLKKTALPQTARQRAQSLHRRALSLFAEGRYVDGEKKLRGALAAYPAHIESRSLLAARKIRANRLAEADELLVAGLDGTGRHPQLAKMRARVLVAMDRVETALQVLQGNRPPVGMDPEYYAFHAALLQRVGNHEAATDQYKNALLIHPSRGLWWMGLAISLEAMGHRQDAVRAYTKARKAGLAKKAIRHFVETRLSALNS